VKRVSTSASREKSHELGPVWGLFFWLLARYLDPVSNERTFHEMRTRVLVACAQSAYINAGGVALMLTGAELIELRMIGAMGQCHVPGIGMAERLADFKLVEPGVCDRAWTITPWGKLVAQAAKEGAQ
jgi:hypothetical protein